MKLKILILSYVLGCLIICAGGAAAIRSFWDSNATPESAAPPETTEAALLIQAETDPLETESIPVTFPEETVPAPREVATTEPAEVIEEPQETSGEPGQETQPSAKTVEVVYSTGNQVNVRSGPGKQHPVLGKLRRGDCLDRTGEEDGWSQILYHGEEAYVSSRYLTMDSVNPRTSDDRRQKPENKAELQAPAEPEKPRPTEETKTPEAEYREVDETVYCTGNSVNIRGGAGWEYGAFGQLFKGDTLRRTGIGSNGWSRVVYEDQEAYVSSQYLTTEKVEDPRWDSTSFSYAYCTPRGIMPYGFFTPEHADPDQPLPLLISLHGASEVGKSRGYFEKKFLVNDFMHWDASGLQGFDAYILCPHMTGDFESWGWNNREMADCFYDLIDYVLSQYNIDTDHIMLQGQSMGGQGVLYMASDERACFSCVTVISGYEPHADYGRISVPVRGYNGSPYLPKPREDWNSYYFMEKIFHETFSSSDWYVRRCSHDEIPIVAFHEDLDGDGQSDLMQWMLAQ